MDQIRKQRGLMALIARRMGKTRATVTGWKQVPAEHVVLVEEVTGIPRHKLRPDLHLKPSAAEATDRPHPASAEAA